MVGLSLALLLAAGRRTWRITVLEAYAPPTDGQGAGYRPSFDARSSALSHHSRLIFERLGLWPALSAHVAGIETIDVSDRGHVGGTHMTAAEQGLPALGYVVENAWLGTVLGDAVAAEASIELLAPAVPAAVRPGRDGVTVTLESGGPVLHADLLVIADGAQSRTRAMLGIEAVTRDYGQRALIANVALDRPHGGVAWERFADAGPLALLPLPDLGRTHRAALVWTLPPERGTALVAAPESEFLRALHDQFGYRAGCIEQVGERIVYPLQLITAREQCRRHVAVVGNAAHSLHPVAGQGFNLSLRDVDRLARVLDSEAAAPGDLALLQQYQARSHRDQEQTIALSDGLPRLFGGSAAPLALGRTLGLLGLDAAPPLRRAFARRGMGFNP